MKRISIALICLLMLSVTAFAADQRLGGGSGPLATTLQVKATAQTAIMFKLQTAGGAFACNVGPGTAPNDYSMDFGTVDGLGMTATGCSNKVAGTGGYYWLTNYAYVARFAGFPNVAATKLEAAVDANPTGFALYEGAAGSVNDASSLTALTTTAAQIGPAVIPSSPTAVTRTLALFVAEGVNTPSNTYSQVVTFTLTPQ